MILDTLRKNVNNFFVKSQKAQYAVTTQTKDSGNTVPAQYSPEIREKIYRTPVVFMAIDAIANEVSKVDWEIVPKKSILDQFGYGTNGSSSKSVLTTKQWSQFKTKYTTQNENEISKETLQKIEKVYALLEDPNDNNESFTSIRKKLAVDLKIHDAAALEKIKNGTGEIVEIYTVPAPYIRMNFDKNGKLLEPAFKQYDKKFPREIVAEWNKDELIYMLLNPISTSMYGISPLDVIAQVVATLVNAMNYNGSYFESAALPEGFFTLPGMTEVQARRLMQKWEQDIKSKHHKVVFMPEGAKWNQFRFNNVEMQWLQGQKWYSEIVYAVLGVTKNELGFTEDINKSNGENQSFVFKNKSILPILNAIAEKINQELIGKQGFGYTDVQFVFKNVDLADKETMDKIHDRAVKSGRMTINETREEMGLAPYKGFGNQPVVATSQGLIFLEQFAMQFDEYKEEDKWMREQAAKENIPVAEYRRRVKTNQENKIPGSQDGIGNSGSQPKNPPTAPNADEKPQVDETKETKFVSGLKEILEKIDKV